MAGSSESIVFSGAGWPDMTAAMRFIRSGESSAIPRRLGRPVIGGIPGSILSRLSSDIKAMAMEDALDPEDVFIISPTEPSSRYARENPVWRSSILAMLSVILVVGLSTCLSFSIG